MMDRGMKLVFLSATVVVIASTVIWVMTPENPASSKLRVQRVHAPADAWAALDAASDLAATEARIEHLIPALRNRTTKVKLRTLRWWLTVPGTKIVSLFPDLNSDRATPLTTRCDVARLRIETAIRLLERSPESARASRF